MKNNKKPKTKSMLAFDKALGAKIRTRREGLDMNQNTFRKELRASYSKVSRWESGFSSIPPMMIVRMAKILGCTLDELFGGVGAE